MGLQGQDTVKSLEYDYPAQWPSCMHAYNNNCGTAGGWLKQKWRQWSAMMNYVIHIQPITVIPEIFVLFIFTRLFSL